MIKGLAITPPVLGRISIGRVVEKGGIRLPQKDNQFTVTSQVQERDRWILHPIDEELRKDSPNGKLRTIPVRMLFNDPDLNLRADYSMFDRKSGRPMCVGDGETCQRLTQSGVESLPCPGPTLCEFGRGGLCKPYGRLHVKIGDDEDLGSFIFRTTGFNSIRTLSARLSYYQAVSGDRLAYLPLELRLRGKSTTQSHRAAIYYVDLTIRKGLPVTEAVEQAQEAEKRIMQTGYNQAALEMAAQRGFDNALFEHHEEEVAEIMDEFYPREVSHADTGEPATLSQRSSLMKVREIKSLLEGKTTHTNAKAAK